MRLPTGILWFWCPHLPRKPNKKEQPRMNANKIIDCADIIPKRCLVRFSRVKMIKILKICVHSRSFAVDILHS
jgi:hypothetical protein